MKKILLLFIFFLSLINCEKDSSVNTKEKFFDPQKLPLLSLEDVVNFWDNDSLEYCSNYFEDYSGYQDGLNLRCDEKGISVVVFVSQAKAIEAMERLINTVAFIIQPGTPNEILKGKWWFGDGIPNAVFVNQWNTIVEVYCYHTDYEEVETLLMETAAEIARRIDSLSN